MAEQPDKMESEAASNVDDASSSGRGSSDDSDSDGGSLPNSNESDSGGGLSDEVAEEKEEEEKEEEREVEEKEEEEKEEEEKEQEVEEKEEKQPRKHKVDRTARHQARSLLPVQPLAEHTEKKGHDSVAPVAGNTSVLAALRPVGSAPAKSAVLDSSQTAVLKAKFEELDVTNDGMLEKAEVKAALVALLPDVDTSVMQAVLNAQFSRVDRDLSGALSFSEFKQFYQAVVPQLSI
jgi:hypothetical protein